jgi:hypothetical protein
VAADRVTPPGQASAPRTGDRVILEEGVLATVEDADGDPDGSIRIVADGQVLTRNWWAIVLPGM